MTSPPVRRAAATLGAAAAMGSLARPYATIGSADRVVSVAVALDPRSPMLAFGILVTVSAAVAVVDHTRGEQLLGILFAVVLVAGVLGPLVVPEFRGAPEPGLWLLLIGWVLVDVADDLDPDRRHPRFGRWLAVDALTMLLLSGSVFLWVHRTAVTTGWTVTLRVAWLASGVVAVAGWLVAAAWEWTAERESSV